MSRRTGVVTVYCLSGAVGLLSCSGIPGPARKGFTAMAVNRAVSSHPGRVRLPGLMFRTWRSCGTADGTAAPWWRSTPGASPPAGWNEGYEPAILGGGDSADSPAALGFGPTWFGTRWAADVAERIEDRGPRLLSAPRRIYLGDRPGEPGPHGQNRRLPRFTYSISTWPDKLLGTHPLNRLLSKSRSSKLPRLPNSGGISSRSDGSR